MPLTAREYEGLADLIKVLRYSPIIAPSHDYSFDQWVQGVTLWASRYNPRFDPARFLAATRAEGDTTTTTVTVVTTTTVSSSETESN